MPSFSDLKSEYARLWALMTIWPVKDASVTSIAKKLMANKARYRAAERLTGVPWVVIAAWHNRESSANFNTQLAQGDPLNQVSTHVPRGRGPFRSWEDGAYDALVTLKHLDKVKDWSPERVCYETERYNGFGYRNQHPDVLSPYLWSFSNHYTRGKYVADGQFDPSAVDKQCGAIPIIKKIMELDSSVQLKPGVKVQVKTPAIIATTAGGAGAALAQALGAEPGTVIGILAVAAVAAIAFIIWKRTRD